MGQTLRSYLEQTILPEFGIQDTTSIEPIPLSLINRTFFVHAEHGSYVLQRMAQIFGTETLEDMQLVTQHLQNKKIPTINLLTSSQGTAYFKDEKNYLWKLMVAIPGETYHVVPSTTIARQAGETLGQFLAGMEDFDANTLHSPLKLHQTKHILDDWRALETQAQQLVTPEQWALLQTIS